MYIYAGVYFDALIRCIEWGGGMWRGHDNWIVCVNYIYGYIIYVYMQMYILMRWFVVSNGRGMGRGHDSWIVGVYHIYMYMDCVWKSYIWVYVYAGIDFDALVRCIEWEGWDTAWGGYSL